MEVSRKEKQYKIDTVRGKIGGKKVILILVILLNTCALATNLKAQQDSCSYMNPIFAEGLC